jgi:hypothetical protein
MVIRRRHGGSGLTRLGHPLAAPCPQARQALDQLYQLVVAHTPQLRITSVNRNIAGSLGLLYDSADVL